MKMFVRIGAKLANATVLTSSWPSKTGPASMNKRKYQHMCLPRQYQTPALQTAQRPVSCLDNLTVKKPRLSSLLLALVPFTAMCFSVSAWDRVYPMVLGLPFNLFWLTSWIVLTPLCMWGAYRLETPRQHNEDHPPT
jgi:hypothetical protein